jgi:hypothetical protein
MLVLIKNSLVKKEVAKVCCRDAGASSCVAKIRGKVFAYFHAVVVKSHSNMRNSLFSRQGRIFFFVNDPLHIKENYEQALEFSLHLSLFFGLSEFGISVNGSCFLPQMLVYSLPGFPCYSFRDLHKNVGVTLSDPLRNRISPHKRFQIKGLRNQHINPAA